MEYRKVKILCIMIESNLLLNDECVKWADEYILCHDNVEQWILELAFTKSNDDASKVLYQEFLSTNVEREIDNLHADLYISSLLLRHILGRINWQTFLLEAGYYSDGSCEGKVPCEFYFNHLNNYEHSFYSESLYKTQYEEIKKLLECELVMIEEHYDFFSGNSPNVS